MQRKVLDNLYRQGGLTLFAFPCEQADTQKSAIPLESLQNLALALNAGASFVLMDFSGKHPFNDTVLKRSLPENDDQFRELYHLLQEIKKTTPQIIGLLPQEVTEVQARYLALIARGLIIADNDEPNSDAAAIYLEDAPSLQKIPLLWLHKFVPNRRRFPGAAKAVKRSVSLFGEVRKSNWQTNPAGFVKIIENLHKLEILRKNPLDGISKVFKRFFPLFLLLAITIPFFFFSHLEPGVSNIRNRTQERDHLSVAPSFEYVFDGKETMQRIARYAIGRFNATITNERMIRQYVNVTLDENGYDGKSWEKNGFHIPPAGTTIKYSRPDYLGQTATDSIGAAWKYWTSIVSDSISYLTEFYHAKPSANQRQHNGIDLASRQGARILAPFAAKAWTSKDERGGVIIGLVREKDVILFMHCDKLLYLDGQEVMAGDPIATVGITGHTTGPHAHVVTGLIDRNGDKRIGNVRYKVIDPIKWFYLFKPNSP